MPGPASRPQQGLRSIVKLRAIRPDPVFLSLGYQNER